MTRKSLNWIFRLSLILVIAFGGCGNQQLSPEDKEKAEKLKAELRDLQEEVKSVSKESEKYSGGLLKAFKNMRLDLLKTTETLVQQRIHAIEAGIKITLEVVGSQPDEGLAAKLEQEIVSETKELANAQKEADKYSGGLLQATALITVATHEQTIALLTQRRLVAKYGLNYPRIEGSLENQASKRPSEESASSGESNPEPTQVQQPKVEDQIITVALLKKKNVKGDYKESIIFNLKFTASGLDKPARSIKGVLLLQDLFGETKLPIRWTIDKALKPGESYTEDGSGIEYNQFKDSHQWVYSTDIENMKAVFTVTNILYADGAQRNFE